MSLTDYRVHTGVDVSLVDPLAERLQQLLDRFAGRVLIISGRRSYAEQTVLWLQYLGGGNLAARPGTSNHERGLAADLRIVDPAVSWPEVHAAAGEVGLRFPIGSEDWHVEADPAWTPPTSPTSEEDDMKAFQLIDDGGNVHLFVPGQPAVNLGGLPSLHYWLRVAGLAEVVNAGQPVPQAEMAGFIARWNA